jgi:hypothetical protein
MDTLPLLAFTGAAIGGAVAGAAACYWLLSRAIIELRRRVAHAEQAHTAAIERSAQARDQVAQLNRAITELRRARSIPVAASIPAAASVQATVSPSREAVEKALAEGDEKTRALPRQGASQAFADTQVMGNL